MLPGLLFLLPLAVLWHPRAPRGSLALLLTLVLGLLLPPALLVDGEGLEGLVLRLQPSPASGRSITWLSVALTKQRRLDLKEQVLLAKPPPPETLALIRAGKWLEGWHQIEPLNLQGRSLRRAQMAKVILIRADLRQAQMQGADLQETYLQGGDLWKAQMQGAKLMAAQMQGANLLAAQMQGVNLSQVKCQGANLGFARLQGADLSGGKLQGAILHFAELQGANLGFAQMQGADLVSARLQGSDLAFARLQGTDLHDAMLQGADLRKAQLQGVDLRQAKLYSFSTNLNAELIDARAVSWEPLSDNAVRELRNEIQIVVKDQKRCQRVLDRLLQASTSSPPIPKLELQSCLARLKTPLDCQKRYDPEKPEELAAFKEYLHAYLAELACADPEIARGLLHQIPTELPEEKQASSRQGLGAVLKKRLADPNCKGLQGLTPEEKDILKNLD